MKKPITVHPHLSLEEIEVRYRKAKGAVERSHWQIIWLLAENKTTKEIQEFTGYCLAWIRTIAHRYNQSGPQAIIGIAIPVAPSCSLPSNKPSWNRPWRLLLLMAACGPDAKSRNGSWPKRDAKSIRSGAGSI